MSRSINAENVRWLGRLALIILLVGLLDGLVVTFVAHPRPWVALIPCLIPLLNALFVIAPWMKAHSEAEAKAQDG